MAKIGIMGGTFDPIHNAHIALAKQALTEYDLDKVLVIPNHIPWMKSDRKITPDEDRINMTKLAIKNEEKMEVSLIEIEAGGNSYTYETLQHLKEINPCDELFFIMGADSLLSFEKWKHPESILKNATLLVTVRDDCDFDGLESQKNHLLELFGGDIQFLHMNLMPVSSTLIRDSLHQYYVLKNSPVKSEDCNNAYQFMECNDLLDSYLPKLVKEYILSHNLYM